MRIIIKVLFVTTLLSWSREGPKYFNFVTLKVLKNMFKYFAPINTGLLREQVEEISEL
jgi:hypothetical protein